jgi:hypothetical protein
LAHAGDFEKIAQNFGNPPESIEISKVYHGGPEIPEIPRNLHKWSHIEKHRYSPRNTYVLGGSSNWGVAEITHFAVFLEEY